MLSVSLRIYFVSLWGADLKIYGFAPGRVWTEALSGKKKLQIQKYPDTCGRDLNFYYTYSFFFLILPPFSLIRDFGKQNTRENVSKISVSLVCH